MAIRNILINVTDVQRSVDFYRRFLRMEPVAEVTSERAVLNAVTATFELVRVETPSESTWESDDLQRGFRHVGFKVDKVDRMVAELKQAGVPFHLEPIDAEGGVRITFFYDPDGTLLELVEGPLQYHEVVDEAGVRADWALGVPERPRFDHVAVTVADFAATSDYYGSFGFGHIGTIHQAWDPRGYEINFLKGGDTVLEIFTYDNAEKRLRNAQLDEPGFVAAVLEAPGGPVPEGRAVGAAASGVNIITDPDGFPYAVAK